MTEFAQIQTKPTVPLAAIVVAHLRPALDGDEKLLFSAQGAKALGSGLEALLGSGQPIRPALEQLLGLALVLRDQQASPTAAARIGEVVSSSPQALLALGVGNGDPELGRRATERLSGGEVVLQAPVLGGTAPPGAAKMWQMLNPLALGRSLPVQKGNSERKPAPATPAKSPGSRRPTPRRRFEIS
jgi:hypothetical protein